MSTNLSFLTVGIPSSSRLVYRPVYPQSSGHTVTFFNGVSDAPTHQGISRPVVHLTSLGGGTYSVSILSGVENTKDDAVMRETYLIDGVPV